MQKLQVARQTLQLPSLLGTLDRFDLIILDDLSYVRKDRAETSVLFELIAERYERRSLLITANQPFSGRRDVFPDPSMTVAASDRLVHHSAIIELDIESYRRRNASDNKRARRRQFPKTEPEGATTMTTCPLTQDLCYHAVPVASCNLLPSECWRERLMTRRLGMTTRRELID